MKRPNEKYALSKGDDSAPGQEGMTFHYNRERRLSTAPKEVQDIYKEKKPTRFGLLGSLVADKPRRMLFILIIVLCLAVLMLSRFGYFDATYLIDGNRLEVIGTKFEETTIVVIKKTVRDSHPYTGAVDIAVSPSVKDEDENYPIFPHRVFFSLEKEEVYRFAVPFDTEELVMVLQTEKSTLQLKFKPE